MSTCPLIPGFKDALEFSRSLNEKEQKAFSDFLTIHTKAPDAGKSLAELITRAKSIDPATIGKLFLVEQPVAIWTLKFAEIVSQAKTSTKQVFFFRCC